MKVETYEVISVDEQNGDIVNELVSEEAMALIESLGLDGQRELLAEKTADGEQVTVRNPYRVITKEELAIFGAIMPRRLALTGYSDGPIPLRVLQVAAHAKDLFDEIEVWCPEKGRDDPLLIGIKGGNGAGRSRWGGERFILARWGEVLDDLDTLRAKAKAVVLARVKGHIAKARAAVGTFESGLEANLDSYLMGNGDTAEYLPSLTFER